MGSTTGDNPGAGTPATAGPRRRDPRSSDVQVHGYSFEENLLGDKQFLAVCVAIAVDPLLEFVRIPNTGLRDTGLVAMCDQLKRSKSLMSIDVSQNRFSLSGARALLSLVQAVPSLEEVIAFDTCLDPAFVAKRGLKKEYTNVSQQIYKLLTQRRIEFDRLESGDD